MKKFQHNIKDELGLHARPASMLVTETKKYNSKITVIYGEKNVDARSVIGLMTMAAKTGDTITICIEGDDEEKACEELQKFCETNV